MGIFITLLVLVVIGYFVQLGLRRGAFPVTVTLAVIGLAFLIAMDFRLQMAHALRNYLPWSGQDLLVGGYIILFLLFFCLFGFFALKYPPQIAPLKRPLDVIAGGVIGAMAGIALSGSLALGWFGSSWTDRYPIPENTIYLKPYSVMLKTFGYLGNRLPGNKEVFDLAAELEKMRAKGLAMPRSRDGFWVASIGGGQGEKKGLRVFIDTIKSEPPSEFKRKLKEWVRGDWLQGPIRGGTVVWGLMGKTPVFMESDAATASIAVETILPPGLPVPQEKDNPLVNDGQSDTMYYADDGKRHFLKIYRMRKKESEEICKLIALMYLKDASQKDIEAMIPDEESFNVKNVENAQQALMNDGLSEQVADHVLDLLRRCGRVVYKAKDGASKVIEVATPDGEVNIETIESARTR